MEVEVLKYLSDCPHPKSEFHISKSDRESSVLESSWVTPGEENRVELFCAEVPVAVLVQQTVDDLDDMGIYLVATVFVFVYLCI